MTLRIDGHSSLVTDFSFSPHDDGLLATGSQDQTVKVNNLFYFLFLIFFFFICLFLLSHLLPCAWSCACAHALTCACDPSYSPASTPSCTPAPAPPPLLRCGGSLGPAWSPILQSLRPHCRSRAGGWRLCPGILLQRLLFYTVL